MGLRTTGGKLQREGRLKQEWWREVAEERAGLMGLALNLKSMVWG